MEPVKRILVTGAAGYIGSHTVKLLLEKGYEVIGFDNLSAGSASAVTCPLIIGDLSDSTLLNKVFAEYSFDAVIHFAGSLLVEESTLLPEKYFRNNVVNGLNLIRSMSSFGVSRLIFSSSAAIYGNPMFVPIDEEHPKSPVNPYGETKLIFEKILKWYSDAYRLSSVSLRYFNAAGASLDSSIGENHPIETHLIPKILKVAGRELEELSVFGKDYETPDGTCIRDYIHVLDLAQAHLLALKKLDSEEGVFAYNVGTGKGYSILEVVASAVEITGKMIPIQYADRRPGDPAVLVADPSRIKNELGFAPQYSDIKTIMTTAWAWQQKLMHAQTPVAEEIPASSATAAQL